MRRAAVLLGLLGLMLLALPVPAAAATPGVAVLVPSVDLDCKESPTPDMPGRGLAAFFGPEPDRLPPEEDPFAEGATTTVYEQYGFAGLRWSTYDLGCGPDAARNPDAVIGTAVGNWVMNAPVSMAALTASLTEVAFRPTFLAAFDPMLTRVSSALHESLFSRWVPAVVALVGIGLLLRARGMALASATGAVAWALFVVIVAAALFRWPVEAGRFADDTVTASLAAVVDGLNGGQGQDPATSVASNVQSSVLYTAWLAGTLGSTESQTAQRFGPELFKATTLTWREAALVQADPERGRDLIEDKRDRFGAIADQLREDDPTAYEFLTGERSDTRVAYALLAAFATVLALPFLLFSALLLLGSFFVVRLAVMLFPALATLGAFPAARGIVLGVGRTVGAALVNAVIFGVGAAVTILVFGLILDPATAIPLWLRLVLLPLFGLIMWIMLKPFRRLTSMAGRHADPFAEGASLGQGGRSVRRLAKRVVTSGVAAYAGGRAAAAHGSEAQERLDTAPPERVEAQPGPVSSPVRRVSSVPALEARQVAGPRSDGATAGRALPPPSRRGSGSRGLHGPAVLASQDMPMPPPAEAVPLPPTEPEWFDGEEIYPIYRPAAAGSHDVA